MRPPARRNANFDSAANDAIGKTALQLASNEGPSEMLESLQLFDLGHEYVDSFPETTKAISPREPTGGDGGVHAAKRSGERGGGHAA